jgi:hypothetical protein
LYRPDRSPSWALLAVVETSGWVLVYALKDALWAAILVTTLMLVITVTAWWCRRRGE